MAIDHLGMIFLIYIYCIYIYIIYLDLYELFPAARFQDSSSSLRIFAPIDRVMQLLSKELDLSLTKMVGMPQPVLDAKMPDVYRSPEEMVGKLVGWGWGCCVCQFGCLDGGFKYCLFSPLFGEDSSFD